MKMGIAQTAQVAQIDRENDEKRPKMNENKRKLTRNKAKSSNYKQKKRDFKGRQAGIW